MPRRSKQSPRGRTRIGAEYRPYTPEEVRQIMWYVEHEMYRSVWHRLTLEETCAKAILRPCYITGFDDPDLDVLLMHALLESGNVTWWDKAKLLQNPTLPLILMEHPEWVPLARSYVAEVRFCDLLDQLNRALDLESDSRFAITHEASKSELKGDPKHVFYMKLKPRLMDFPRGSRRERENRSLDGWEKYWNRKTSMLLNAVKKEYPKIKLTIPTFEVIDSRSHKIGGVTEDVAEIFRTNPLLGLRHPDASPEQISAALGEAMDANERWTEKAIASFEQNISFDLLLMTSPELMREYWLSKRFSYMEKALRLMRELPPEIVKQWIYRVVSDVVNQGNPKRKYVELATSALAAAKKTIDNPHFRTDCFYAGKVITDYEIKHNIKSPEVHILVSARCLCELLEDPRGMREEAQYRVFDSATFYWAWKSGAYDSAEFWHGWALAMERYLSWLEEDAKVGKRVKIGGMTEDLEALFKRDPWAAIRHPEASPEQLAEWISNSMWNDVALTLAAFEENPSRDLLLLESPQLLLPAYWECRCHAASNRLSALARMTAEPILEPWLVRVAKDILPLWKPLSRTDHVPYEAVDAAVHFLKNRDLKSREACEALIGRASMVSRNAARDVVRVKVALVVMRLLTYLIQPQQECHSVFSSAAQAWRLAMSGTGSNSYQYEAEALDRYTQWLQEAQ